MYYDWIFWQGFAKVFEFSDRDSMCMFRFEIVFPQKYVEYI